MRDIVSHDAPLDLNATLAPVRRSIGLTRIAIWGVRGLGAGALVGAIVLAPAHFRPLPLALPIAVTLLGFGVALGIFAGMRHWPNVLETARAVDRHFSLHDRLTTVLEYTSSDPLPTLLRSDARRHLDGLSLRQSNPNHLAPAEAGLAILAVCLFGALAASGGAHASHSAAHNGVSDTQRIHRAAVHVPQLQHKLQHSLTPAQQHNVTLRQLQQSLTRLQRQLLKAPNRAAALRTISKTQQYLHHLSSRLHPVNPQAATQLSRSLAHYLTPQQRAALARGGNKALASAARALNRLARQLGHMSRAQRAQLARALERAANQTSNNTLRASLHQAASSLAYHDAQTARASLQQAAKSMAQSPAQAAAQASLANANSQLDSIKNSMAGLENKSSGTPSGTQAGQSSGQHSSSGQSAGGDRGQGSRGQGQTRRAGGQGRGKGSGHGTGRGAGRGQGTGRGQGRGSGQASGAHGTGSHGVGGGRGGSGQHGRGHMATVYAPGRQGKGPNTIQRGSNGSPLRSPLVPYHQVLGRYTQSARTALDHTALPPNLRSYVQRYFSSISGSSP